MQSFVLSPLIIVHLNDHASRYVIPPKRAAAFSKLVDEAKGRFDERDLAALLAGLQGIEYLRKDARRVFMRDQTRLGAENALRDRSPAFKSKAAAREQWNDFGLRRLKFFVMYGFNLHCGKAHISKPLWRPLAQALIDWGYETDKSVSAETTDATELIYRRLYERKRELSTRRSFDRAERERNRKGRTKAYLTYERAPLSADELKVTSRNLFAGIYSVTTVRVGGIRRRTFTAN